LYDPDALLVRLCRAADLEIENGDRRHPRDAHRYSTIVEREGVRLRVPGYGFMRALPHDLAHFVVERGLALDRGFWGSVADGAEFGGMQRIEGRRKPHASEAAKQTSKENADNLSEAELLVAYFERIVEEKLDGVPQLAEAELRKALATVRHYPRGITGSEIAEVCAAWRIMQARRNELPIGEALHFKWRSVRSRGKHRQRRDTKRP
jgi:hypothetical protein